jgi:hypothetical protein
MPGTPTDSLDRKKTLPKSFYCSFVYSDFASFRMGMSGAASFQRVRKSISGYFRLTIRE